MVTKLQSFEQLARTLRENEGELIAVEITSIVNGNVLSSYKVYSKIESALFTEFEGEYQTKSGYPGASLFDGKGIILNLGDASQLFIDELAKIDERHNENSVSIRIKDVRSSMHIHLQIIKMA